MHSQIAVSEMAEPLFAPAAGAGTGPAQLASLDERFLHALGARFAELGIFRFERMQPGAEATALTKVIAQGEFVLKAIDEVRAEEEVRQIRRIGEFLPSFFPRLVHAQIDSGQYAIEFVAGEPLDVAMACSPLPDDADSVAPPIVEALDLLRRLHELSQRPYGGKYHDVIVHQRALIIPECPRISIRFEQLRQDHRMTCSWETSDAARRLASHLAMVRRRYEEVLPPNESLIHGDPHLGNIIAKRGGGVCFIDPRVTWDEITNPDPGFFDPLYDPACVAHSLIAHSILRSREYEQGPACTAAGTTAFLQPADMVLNRYLGRPAQPAERIRYRVYLACALLGNLRYAQWTPSWRAFVLTIEVAQQALVAALT